MIERKNKGIKSPMVMCEGILGCTYCEIGSGNRTSQMVSLWGQSCWYSIILASLPVGSPLKDHPLNQCSGFSRIQLGQTLLYERWPFPSTAFPISFHCILSVPGKELILKLFSNITSVKPYSDHTKLRDLLHDRLVNLHASFYAKTASQMK